MSGRKGNNKKHKTGSPSKQKKKTGKVSATEMKRGSGDDSGDESETKNTPVTATSSSSSAMPSTSSAAPSSSATPSTSSSSSSASSSSSRPMVPEPSYHHLDGVDDATFDRLMAEGSIGGSAADPSPPPPRSSSSSSSSSSSYMSSAATSSSSSSSSTPPIGNLSLSSSPAMSTSSSSSSSKPDATVASLDDSKEESKEKETAVKKEEVVDPLADTIVRLLVGEEQKVFDVARKFVTPSDLIKTMLEGDKEAKDVPVPNVKPAVFEKILKYLNYHHQNPAREIEKPIKSQNLNEIVSDYDAEFMEVDQALLFDIILAANYLDVKPLLELSCCKVATMMKGKDTVTIRKTFNIVNDFTPEEEEAVRAENKWAEES